MGGNLPGEHIRVHLMAIFTESSFLFIIGVGYASLDK
jgi:hypothetical protein